MDVGEYHGLESPGQTKAQVGTGLLRTTGSCANPAILVFTVCLDIKTSLLLERLWKHDVHSLAPLSCEASSALLRICPYPGELIRLFASFSPLSPRSQNLSSFVSSGFQPQLRS